MLTVRPMKIPLAKANSSFSCYQQVGVTRYRGVLHCKACKGERTSQYWLCCRPWSPRCAHQRPPQPLTTPLQMTFALQQLGVLLAVACCRGADGALRNLPGRTKHLILARYRSVPLSGLQRTGSAADALISDRPPSAAATVYGGLPNVPVTLSHHLCMLFAA